MKSEILPKLVRGFRLNKNNRVPRPGYYILFAARIHSEYSCGNTETTEYIDAYYAGGLRVPDGHWNSAHTSTKP